jgi:hypothetical protein
LGTFRGTGTVRMIGFGRAPRRSEARRAERGQSMAEFVLVVPILLFLVVIVADFGRIFATGLSLEAAARDAAEVVANAYLSRPPSPLNAPASAPSGYYDEMHVLAANTVCAETSDLPNANFDSATGTCAGMPLVTACIHDSGDLCGGSSDAQGATIPAECNEMAAPMSSTQGAGLARYVEVRVCYRFTPILNMPMFAFGDFWLQRTRTFGIPCYFVLGSDECG